MLKTLRWWYDIKGNSIDKAQGGLNIIPFIYKEAEKYYYLLYQAHIENEKKDLKNYKVKEKIVEIESPIKKKTKRRTFNFEEE